MADSHFVDFHSELIGCSLLAHIDPPRTLYSSCSRCLGSLAVIQQRAREKIANNHFELLFINIQFNNLMKNKIYTIKQFNVYVILGEKNY